MPSLEYIDACLPITGLKGLVLGDTKAVLQGHGPYSRLIDERSGELLAEIRTFKRNNVHGFLILQRTSQDAGQEYLQIVAWGGQSVRLIDLNLLRSGPQSLTASFTAASAEYWAPDWILSGCSFRVHEQSRACLVTAHNAVIGLQLVDSTSPNYQKSIHLQQLVTGVRSILYSADIIALSRTHVLVAAGTVFGEIIVWSCFLDESKSFSSNAVGSIHHFFTGHEGSIFGVSISPEIPSLHGSESGRLLASCSDDRTVRIWDISDCECTSRHDPSAYSTDGFELRSTGFGVGSAADPSLESESCVAKAFGHVARIWGVHFLPTIVEGQPKLDLISRGEDATCLFWSLTWEPSSSEASQFQLREVSSIHRHSGKHIWSLGMCGSGPDTSIFTGGADGALKTLKVIGHDGMNNATVRSGNDSSPNSPGALKSFSFVSQDCFLGTSFTGEVKLGRIGSQTRHGAGANPPITWEILTVEEDLRSFSVISGLPQHRLALVGNASGLIRLYNHGSKTILPVAQADERPLGIYILHSDVGLSSDSFDTLSFVTSYVTTDKATLFMVKSWESEEPYAKNITVALPATFDVACASLVCDNQYLVLGSKVGALAWYRVSGSERTLQPLGCIRRIHGQAGVNQISSIASTSKDSGTRSDYILTCGRDGNYCVHELNVSKDGETAVSLQTVHRSFPYSSHNVEGAYFDKTSHDLILYGFRGKDFVLWNESAQTELFSIECGGSRRCWAYSPYDGDSGSGLFLWNQSSSFNAFRIRTDSCRTLRAGGHGREIKSMAISNVINGGDTLIATGAEDTIIRIFAPVPSKKDSPWGTFKCLRALNKHGTGLQQVSWSRSGDYLFTSGGYEEFFVWRVKLVPNFGVATMLMASNPKDDPKSELRVTSFDVLDVKGRDCPDGFLFCLTYSNSTLKIFHFSPSGERGHFTLLARGTYMANCLTQAHFVLKGTSISLTTAATDGYFTLWNLTSVLEPFYNFESSALALKQPLEESHVTPQVISYENQYRVHQNSIKSMEVVDVSDTASLIIAGGDDNALSLSLLHTSPAGSETEIESRVATVSIPDAHAASVTAIKVLEQRSSRSEEGAAIKSIVVASSGNDHQVKLWSIDVDSEKEGPEEISIKNVLDRYSAVADISSLDVIQSAPGESAAENTVVPGTEAESKLLVCGVGMEMLYLRLR